MKTTSTIVAGLLVAALSFAVVTSNAQPASEPAVKILPTNQEGILKVLYAYETDQSVEVKFFNEGGLITADKITASNSQHGFSKKYDVRNIESATFWVEVTAANLSVTYRVTESKDGKYKSFLEKATYNYPVVASLD